MTRRLSLAAAFVMLAAGGAACRHASVESVETTEAVPVAVQPAHVDTLRSTIDVTGVVQPSPGADWTISAPDGGRITEMPKAEGDPVKAGDVLVKFEVPTLTSELTARQSEVSQALARQDLAKAQTARVSGLFDRGIAARKDVEEAKQQEAEADAVVTQARAALAAQQTLVDRMTVTARFAGVVAKRMHNPGDIVAQGDAVLRVVDPTRLEVGAEVPVPDLPRVVVGRPATITAPGSQPEAATVITKPAAVDPASAAAPVRIAFTMPTALTMGTGVSVQIIAEERHDALLVPTPAVVHEDGGTYVMIASADNKAHKTKITTGLVARDFTQVLAGLKAGDLVITRGQDGLPDGAAITVVK